MSDRADALYQDVLSRGEPVIAPVLLPIEVTNIIRQRVRRSLLTEEESREAMAGFRAVQLTLWTTSPLDAAALDLANQYDLPAAYDAYYVVLARNLDATLWTDDRRLLRDLAGRLPFVRSLADY